MSVKTYEDIHQMTDDELRVFIAEHLYECRKVLAETAGHLPCDALGCDGWVLYDKKGQMYSATFSQMADYKAWDYAYELYIPDYPKNLDSAFKLCEELTTPKFVLFSGKYWFNLTYNPNEGYTATLREGFGFPVTQGQAQYPARALSNLAAMILLMEDNNESENDAVSSV